MPETESKPAHFKGKEAIDHVVEAQAKGIIAASEMHGTEIPGHISAGTDAMRETALVAILFWLFLNYLQIPKETMFFSLFIFSIGWLIWKGGRSAWLAWSRLERLHRIVEQEKWEIDHNRSQERDELKALYRAKGFEGKLLEDVMDVLMADGDRLLRVMVEEELGLSLGNQEHPLKQAVGAVIGTLAALCLCLAGLLIWTQYGMIAAGFLAIGLSAGLTARFTQNRIVNAIVWNLGLGVLSVGTVYFLFDYFTTGR